MKRFACAAAALGFALMPLTANAADPANGEKVFKRCAGCHTVAADGVHKQGPNLYGFLGRKAGTATGFEKYSEALKASGIVWDDATLHTFLEKPREFLPGSNMAALPIRKSEERADLIAYLRAVTQ